jgi:hypothetical protein
MRIIKSYSEFITENLNNEGLGELGKKAIGAVKGFLGKAGGFLSALKAQMSGKRSENGADGTIPYGVTIIPSAADAQALDITEMPQITRDEDSNSEEVDEAQVPLDFPNPQAGVINVGAERLLRIINRVLKNKDERPLMIWGAPGIGKTSVVKAVQKQYGGRMIDVQLTTYAPEDFFLPEVEGSTSQQNKYSRRAGRVPQGWLPVYHESEGQAGNDVANGPDGKGGIIFLDELSRAKEAIRNICLKLVLDREMDGGWKLGSNWTIVAASNRMEDDETNTSEFGSALGNRFQQVNYSPSIKDYSKYALSAKSETGEDLFDPRIISFLNWTKGQDFFHKYDPDISGTIFPSPRSWEAAAIALKNLKREAAESGMTLTPEIIENEAIAPNVGKEAASMFMGYYALSQKIDLDKMNLVYSDPMNAPLPPKSRGSNDYEIDSAYILASAIAYEYKDRELTDQEIGNLFEYLVRIGDPTVAIQILTAVRDVQPNVEKNTAYPATAAGIEKFFTAYPGATKEIQAANINP